MANVFVSSECVDNDHIAGLIVKLCQEGFTVSHSPRNPADGEDLRWPTWYEEGCREAISQASVFIIGITLGWDASIWMCIEAEEARRAWQSGRLSHMCFYNPAQIPVQSENMAQLYLHERLPDEAGAATDWLRLSLKERVKIA